MAAEKNLSPSGANEWANPAALTETALASIEQQKAALLHALAFPGGSELPHLPGFDIDGVDLALMSKAAGPESFIFGALRRLESDRKVIMRQTEAAQSHVDTLLIQYASRYSAGPDQAG